MVNEGQSRENDQDNFAPTLKIPRFVPMALHPIDENEGGINAPTVPLSMPPLPETRSAIIITDAMQTPAGLSTRGTDIGVRKYKEMEEEDTPVKMYEYCRVVLDSGQYSQSLGRYPYFVRVALDYFGGQSTPSYKFNQDTDKVEGPDKTWGRMLGMLGAAGWEMVNITIGKAKDMSILEAMAYFKRPVEDGREVDQPKIIL